MKDNLSTYLDLIPEDFLAILKSTQLNRKYGAYTLILQDGKVVGCDTTIKERKDNKRDS